ncbi:glycerol antiterminator regulatory protein [Escherichia coli]|uniref:Glycerol antiterminator regulatory protein n=1 Tax=Escherichia coli TaxID=562 RepID=A0A2X3K1W3_ECOLX|nr:glycerol antiterminator regulatory protein [Escherichia coli]
MPLLHLLRQNPVIAAVKDNASLQLAIDSECQFISVLYGNICTISNIVKKIKNAGNMLLFMLICWKARQIKKS